MAIVAQGQALIMIFTTSSWLGVVNTSCVIHSCSNISISRLSVIYQKTVRWNKYIRIEINLFEITANMYLCV